MTTRYLRGRDAGHFGRWRGATSNNASGPKSPRPLGLQRKSPPGLSKGSTVFPDTLFAILLPGFTSGDCVLGG